MPQSGAQRLVPKVSAGLLKNIGGAKVLSATLRSTLESAQSHPEEPGTGVEVHSSSSSMSHRTISASSAASSIKPTLLSRTTAPTVRPSQTHSSASANISQTLWDYDNVGSWQQRWAVENGEGSCDGRHQSPVDIYTRSLPDSFMHNRANRLAVHYTTSGLPLNLKNNKRLLSLSGDGLEPSFVIFENHRYTCLHTRPYMCLYAYYTRVLSLDESSAVRA